jgi:hypothetical protein
VLQSEFTKNHLDLYERLSRSPGDLDFMGRRKDSKRIEQVMRELSYKPNERINAFNAGRRQIWYAKGNQVDIILDIFQMNHVIDLRDRLELDKPTITPSDLFLQKIQIVEINEKDVKDLFILLAEHELAEDDDDKINIKYISKILSDDWGFYHTTMLNLDKLAKLLPNYPILTKEESEAISGRAEAIVEKLKSSPKSFKWKLREKIGERQTWYNVVEEVVR